MSDPITTYLYFALGSVFYLLVKHAVVEGLRLRREIKETRQQIDLERWRMERQAGSRITLPERKERA